MKKITLVFIGGILPILSACDLQPKIASLPDTVGEFISARYPALLADPVTQPEIYNSAATDYGVYASPELYGTDGVTDTSGADYVMYASVDDYVMPGQDAQVAVDAAEADGTVSDAAVDDSVARPMYGSEQADVQTKEIRVAAGDTLYKLARENNMTVDEMAAMNNLSAPYALSVGQMLKVAVQTESVVDSPLVVPPRKVVAADAPRVATPTKVAVKDIRVAAGDTLYSISRQYAVPVNDLAVMNNLTAPFTLSVGQVLRVPDLGAAEAARPVGATQVKPTVAPEKSNAAQVVQKTEPVKVVAPAVVTAPEAVEKPKISSDPNKKMPKIGARSSSKFAWPVRGRVLSHYGAKGNGLFNDGINIAAARGTAVKAAENGAVAYAGNEVKGMGNLVIVQHSGGWMTVYAHMDSMAVRRGVTVKVGQKIGTVGATGKVDEPQLHFEIRKGTKAYNPETYLKK